MKPFWRNFWASTLALVIAGTLMFLIFFVISIAIIGSFFDSKPFSYKDNSILHIRFDQAISEKSYSSFNQSSFSVDKGLGLREIKIALEAAKNDKKIKGIVINAESMPAGMASTEEIRNALLDFKSSGKFVIAYGEMYTQKSYYLSTAADEIYLYPEGMVEFRGLGAELMFFKGLIDKLGIDMQIIRGTNNKFKSAVEPFMLDSISPANREQTLTYLTAMWSHMLKGISESRNISISELNTIADSVWVRNGKTSKQYKLVDDIIYQDQLDEILRTKVGIKSDEKLQMVNFSKYVRHQAKKFDNEIKDSETNIAVIYAVGSIESGKGDDMTMGSETIAKAIRDARLDDDIKAIVLRINSPGGSALASDVMWREVTLAKKVKPFIVSMGDVAASGGYYIACAADKIYAQPNTITGSIGVFGVIPNFGPMLKEKVGVTTSRVSTNPHALITLTQALTEDEYKIIQQGVDEIYLDFITKVADGRSQLSVAQVDSIGQGRVWAGTDALKLGLVDELGGIDAAIAYAASQAGIDKKDIKIKVMPKSKDELSELIEAFETGGKDEDDNKKDTRSIVRIKMLEMLDLMETITSMKGYQARLPYTIIIE
jgi:protease-4